MSMAYVGLSHPPTKIATFRDFAGIPGEELAALFIEVLPGYRDGRYYIDVLNNEAEVNE